MKLLCLIFTLSLLSLDMVKAKIKNGYVDVMNARESLRSLKEITTSRKDFSSQQFRVMNDKIQMLKDDIACFELTETLLQQFRLIAPELYNEMDSIRDKDHIPTDIYVKFILKEYSAVQFPGTSYIQYKEGDHSSYSEYGANTVSVKIWVMDISLTILAHELGHIKYEIPNLIRYKEYYQQNYKASPVDYNYLGHNPNDLSGKSASVFEKQFSKNHKDYLRATDVKLDSPFKLLNEIRKNREPNQHASIDIVSI